MLMIKTHALYVCPLNFKMSSDSNFRSVVFCSIVIGGLTHSGRVPESLFQDSPLRKTDQSTPRIFSTFLYGSKFTHQANGQLIPKS